VRVHRIHADAEDADAVGEGLVVLGPKLGQLGPSTTSEIEHIEKEDESAMLPQHLLESDLLAARDRQLELSSLVSNLQHN
jgi:hypothetical protein